MRISLPKRLFVHAMLVLAALFTLLPAQAQNTMVRLHTTQGPIDLALLNTEAPLTVANFLAYVRGGDYTNVFFHRSARLPAPSLAPFVIQAGGFKWTDAGAIERVTTRGNVRNEYSASRSNLRGTVAMAKLGGDPDSATSQWFVNLGDNSTNLDNQNGGFTVFARVTAPGMTTADQIAALPVVNAGTNFAELPVADWKSGTQVARSNVVRLTAVTEFPQGQTSSDRIFNFLEAAYTAYLGSAASSAGEVGGYVYRYYSSIDSYVATKDGRVWYFAPKLRNEIIDIGSVTDLLSVAQSSGY
jgi:cyclophilin family peptidyl-prolyl cis-trans isomerase